MGSRSGVPERQRLTNTSPPLTGLEPPTTLMPLSVMWSGSDDVANLFSGSKAGMASVRSACLLYPQ